MRPHIGFERRDIEISDRDHLVSPRAIRGALGGEPPGQFIEELQQAGGFVDAIRHFVPAEQPLYTWWSYRNRDWAASDRGRRLDHVWVTPPLVGALVEARVLRDSRSWDKASDHVPVVIEFGG